MSIVYVLIDRVSMLCRVIFTEFFLEISLGNKNRALEQWIAKNSPSYGSQSKRTKLLAIDLENTYGNYLRAKGSYLISLTSRGKGKSCARV